MGIDKGMIKCYTNTWAQIAADKIADLNINVVVPVYASQYHDYRKIFSKSQLVKDKDEIQLKGPLSGILSVHLCYPTDDLLVLACDMPLMQTALLTQLKMMVIKVPDADTFLYTNDGEPKPLCAIYRATGLARVNTLLQTGQLTRHSMKFTLQLISTFFKPLDKEQKNCFHNFNENDELNRL